MPRTGRVLLTLSGDALSSRMNPVGGEPAGSTPDSTTLLAPSGSAVIWLDVVVRRKAHLPEELEHRVESATRPAPGQESIPFTSVVGRVPLATRPPLKLGPPVAAAASGEPARAAATTTPITVAACSSWTATRLSRNASPSIG